MSVFYVAYSHGITEARDFAEINGHLLDMILNTVCACMYINNLCIIGKFRLSATTVIIITDIRCNFQFGASLKYCISVKKNNFETI